MLSKFNMSIDTKSTFRFIESMIEVTVYSVIYILIFRFLFAENTFPEFITIGKVLLFGIYFFLTWILIKHSDGFEFGNLKVSELCVAQWTGMGITNVITYFQLCLIANKMVNPLPIILLFVTEIILSMLFVIVFSFIHRKLYTAHKMLMVFGSDNAVRMKIKMDSKKQQYKVAELISADKGYDAICEKISQYESVIINDVDAQLSHDLLKFCFEHGITTYVVPKITDILMRGSIPVNAFDTPMLLIKTSGLNLGQRFLKRAMDILISLTGLIVTSPLMLLIAIAIKKEDNGPVFYKQKRATINGREFSILKFRSMIVNAETAGLAIPATGDDPRITKVGKIIRASRL
ncbi:MAG: sugar transferase, partial [Clostridia bacterium]|nr:sugar transferase [Clostridia bacterium]